MSATTLSPQDIAQLQVWVRTNSRNGVPPSVIAAELQRGYGVKLGDVMRVTMRDVGRSAAQGLTLEHADELAGNARGAADPDAGIRARDEVRRNDALFAEAHPVANIAARAGGAMVPGLLAALIPGLQPVAGEIGLNTLRGAGAGILQGAAAGEGASEKPLAESGEDALMGGAVGGAVGGVFGNVASRVGKAGAARAALRAGNRVLPMVPEAMTWELVSRFRLVCAVVCAAAVAAKSI